MAGATYIETLDAFTNLVTAYVHTLLFRHATVENEGADGSTQESSEMEDERTGTLRFETWVEEGRAKFQDLV